MSGVNAHMLVSAPAERARDQDRHPLLWQEQRFWPGPALHHFAHPVESDSALGVSR